MPTASAAGAKDKFLAANAWRLSSGDDVGEVFRYDVAAGTTVLPASGTEVAHKYDGVCLSDEIHPRNSSKPDS